MTSELKVEVIRELCEAPAGRASRTVTRLVRFNDGENTLEKRVFYTKKGQPEKPGRTRGLLFQDALDALNASGVASPVAFAVASKLFATEVDTSGIEREALVPAEAPTG